MCFTNTSLLSKRLAHCEIGSAAILFAPAYGMAVKFKRSLIAHFSSCFHDETAIMPDADGIGLSGGPLSRCKKCQESRTRPTDPLLQEKFRKYICLSRIVA